MDRRGVRTSEFWMSVAVIVAAVARMVGVWGEDAPVSVEELGGMLAAAAVTVAYVWSRVRVKMG